MVKEVDPLVAAEVGKRPPKTARGRRELKKRQPQIVEDSKTALLIRGNKCTVDVQGFLRDVHRLRPQTTTLFMRPHPEHPFEDISRVEKLCVKMNHGLFAFGSSSKKRPFRVILGRLFDDKLLDMMEYGVKDYKGITSFKGGMAQSEHVAGAKPLMVFQGSAFETDENMKRTKSLLLDFFGGTKADQVVLKGLDSAIVCSTIDKAGATGGTATGSSGSSEVLVKRYQIAMSKSGSRLPRIELEETGPRFTLTLDRAKEPDRERWKQSIKVPKAAKEVKVKNVSKDSLNKRHGRIHLGIQNVDQIHTAHHGLAKKKKLRADGLEEKKAPQKKEE